LQWIVSGNSAVGFELPLSRLFDYLTHLAGRMRTGKGFPPMQNLLSKSLVLIAVIGVSCFVVWQAHNGLKQPEPGHSPDEFAALPDGTQPEPTLAGDDQTGPLQGQLQPLPGFQPITLVGNTPEPTLAGAPDQEPEPEPTPAEFPANTVSLIGADSTPKPTLASARAFPGMSPIAPTPDHGPDQTGTTASAGFSAIPTPIGLPAQNNEAPEQDLSPTSGEGTPKPNPFLPLISAAAPGQGELPDDGALAAGTRREGNEPNPIRPSSSLFGPSANQGTVPDQASGQSALAPQMDPQLTKLPPSHPGPLLLPADNNALSGRVRTAEASDELKDDVRQVAGTPFDLSAPEPSGEADVLPQGGPEPTLLPLSAPEPAPEQGGLTRLPPNSERLRGQPASTPNMDSNESPFFPTVRPAAASDDEVLPGSGDEVVPAINDNGGLNFEGAAPLRPLPSEPPAAAPVEPTENPFGANLGPSPNSNTAPTLAPSEEGEVMPSFDFGTPPAQPEATPPARNDSPFPVHSPEPAEPVEPSTGPRIIEFGSPTPQPQPNTPEPSVEPTAFPSLDSRPSSVPAEGLPITPTNPNPGMRTFESSEPVIPTEMNLIGDGTFDPQAPSGPQSPEIKIEKIAPKEASIGEPLVYSIVVRNVGGSPAHHVTVEDRIPRGSRLEGTIPQAVLTSGKLTWDLGTMTPNQEQTIQLKVVPIEPGDIGSVATVSFQASVATSIRVTAPELQIAMNGPAEVIIGDQVSYKFVVSNTGKGAARDVYLRAIIPEALKHPGGKDIEFPIGQLPAGGTREIELSMAADDIGIVTPQALLTIDGQVKADTKADLRIIESRIQVTRTGPEKRFIDRPGTYVTRVTNQSNQLLKNIVVTEAIPTGVVLGENPIEGVWDANRRTISWKITELQPNQSRDLKSILKPTTTGSHAGKLIVHDGHGKQSELATKMDVRGFSDLKVDVARDLAPVAVGEQLSFRMTVRNSGNASANTVQTAFEIPSQFQFVSAKGPVAHRYDVQQNVVTFAALDEIPANVDQSYDIILTASEVCQAEVKVHLKSSEESQQFAKQVTVVGKDTPQATRTLQWNNR